MASEHSSQHVEEEEEEYERPIPRPRRRFRGLHWRHASQTYTPPPPSQSTLQQSPPQLRPLSVNLGQSGFDLDHANPSTLNTTVINPETPPSAGSYSYCLPLLD